MTEKKINVWFWLAWILLLVSIIITVEQLIDYRQENSISSFTYNNVTVTAQDYEAISQEMADKTIVKICNMENQKCIRLIKIQEGK